jgi:hypothetical protein
MELYKIKNGKLKKYNGGFVVIDNMIHTNPSEEIIRQAGYKDLREHEQPDYDIETQYIESVFEDTEDAILVHWEVKKIETPEEVID